LDKAEITSGRGQEKIRKGVMEEKASEQSLCGQSEEGHCGRGECVRRASPVEGSGVTYGAAALNLFIWREGSTRKCISISDAICAFLRWSSFLPRNHSGSEDITLLFSVIFTSQG
jgi:hypothetical protein